MATAVKEPAIQEGAEKVADGLEEIVAAAPASINKGVLFAGGVIIGVSVGFIVAKKILEKKITAEAEAEIQAVRDIYYEKAVKLEEDSGARRVMDEKRSVEEIMRDRGYTAEDQRYTDAEQAAIEEANLAAARAERAAEEAEESAEAVKQNVFNNDGVPDWNWDVETAFREQLDDGVPYVLHRDEYNANERDYEQMVLTYFAGDDVLADNHDTPVDDQDALVGLANLGRFGHGSGDPNTVLVRNPEHRMEYEIVVSEGKFSEQRRGMISETPRDETGRFAPRQQEGDPRKRRSRGD